MKEGEQRLDGLKGERRMGFGLASMSESLISDELMSMAPFWLFGTRPRVYYLGTVLAWHISVFCIKASFLRI